MCIWKPFFFSSGPGLCNVLFADIFACYKTFFMWFAWCHDKLCRDPAEALVLSGRKIQAEQWVTSSLGSNARYSALQSFIYWSWNGQCCHTHTHADRTINTHSPGSQSTDTHQSYECRLASVHWDSWGTNQAMEAAGECHISPPCCTDTHTHTQRETTHVPTCT